MELAARDFPTVRARFSGDTPNAPMLAALLRGHLRGRVWVEEVPHGGVALARLDYYGISFVGGQPDVAARTAVTTLLRGMPSLLVVGEDPRADQLGSAIERVEFTQGADDPDVLASLSRPLPPGVRLTSMNGDLLARCGWRHEIEAACGSTARFLTVGRGICAVWDGAPLCEAYAAFRADGRAELGVYTAPDARGQGLARATCAALLLATHVAGERPSWSCNRDNAASLALARRLGFTGERAYRFVRVG